MFSGSCTGRTSALAKRIVGLWRFLNDAITVEGFIVDINPGAVIIR
jgi:hypothetical protein